MNRWQGDWNCKDQRGDDVIAIYRQVCLFSHQDWSVEHHRHSLKWNVVVSTVASRLSPVKVMLYPVGSSTNWSDTRQSGEQDEWSVGSTYTCRCVQRTQKNGISMIICGSAVLTWRLLLVLQVTVSAPGPLDEGKSSSTSTGFKGFPQVSRITCGEQHQSIMCRVDRVWCNIKAFLCCDLTWQKLASNHRHSASSIEDVSSVLLCSSHCCNQVSTDSSKQ